MKGFIIYSTYRIHDSKPYIYLFGRLENGESFLTINEYRPYFFIRQKDLKLAQEKFKLETEETYLKNKKGEKVVRIYTRIPQEVAELKQQIERQGIKTYEGDIPFARRFLIDKKINSCMQIEGTFSKGEGISRIYKEPGLKPAEFFPELKALSFDLETDRKASQIFSIAMICDNFKRDLIVSDKKFPNADSFKTEKEMLEYFQKKVIELDPDILTSHNVIDFDLRVLRDRFDANGLFFGLGRLRGRTKLKIERGFGRNSSANVIGRVVFDSIDLLKFFGIKLDEGYSLESAAKNILGEKKLLAGHDRPEVIERWFKEDPEKLIEYNLHDAELVLKILEKKNLIKLAIEMSILTGLQPDKIRGRVVSFDNLYLKELRQEGIVAPSTGVYKKEGENVGGYVMDSIPGLYNDYMLIFDFRSLYPSMIWTLGIDPVAFVEEDVKDFDKTKYVKAANGAMFLNKDNIVPRMVKGLLEKRIKAQKEGNAVASHAIKILMNSMFFGIFTNVNFRWFNQKIFNAITTSSQETGHVVMEEIERYCKEEFKLKKAKVIYRDTDSFMVNLGITDGKKAKEIALKIKEHVNKFLDGYVREKYCRENHLYLDYKEKFPDFLMPRLRKVENSETGVKKKYCGLWFEDGKPKIKFVGMEFIHSDWTDLSKEFQHELYLKVLQKQPYKKFVKDFMHDLRQGKFDDKLVYRKNMTKDESEYTATTPPHVKAARKLKESNGSIGSNLIEYVQTTDGPEPVGFVKSPVDYDHYIEKQLRPVAEQIFAFLDVKFEELVKDRRQKALADY